jgi:abortive infection bacteriophage resistance protein
VPDLVSVSQVGDFSFMGPMFTKAAIKPHLTLSEQVTLLKRRGMIITDDAAAVATLERLGYYRLSGYFYPLRKTQPRGVPGRQDEFQTGTSLELVDQLAEFDRELRLVVLDAVERVEVALRCDIAHRLGQRHALAHEMSDELDTRFCTAINPRTGRVDYDDWLQKLSTLLQRAQKEDFVKHHAEKYGGKMPIWVVTEIWDFGLLSKFFAGMRFTDQRFIARRYGLGEAKYLISWLRAINFVRNVSAHHSRLWNRNIIERPGFPATQPHHYLHHLNGNTHAQTRIYGTLCVLKCMLDRISTSHDWTRRVCDLTRRFPKSEIITLEAAGFPVSWDDLPLWR